MQTVQQLLGRKGSQVWSVSPEQSVYEATSQLDAVETIERSSIDFYATTRNLYRQSRNAKINEGKATPTDDLPNL